MIDPHEIRELFDYSPTTGILTWKVRTSKTIPGKIAGSLSNGYVSIKCKQKKYLAHRLAYCHFYGKWPILMIDHIDGNRSNNKIDNLREATNQTNQHNQIKLRSDNFTGHRGVTYSSRLNQYVVQIKVNKKGIYIGIYKDLGAAIDARKNAEKIYHPTRPARSRT